jgi:hypothetical protein
MTEQKFGTKLSGGDRLTEVCCAEKTPAAKNRKSTKVRLFKD